MSPPPVLMSKQEVQLPVACVGYGTISGLLASTDKIQVQPGSYTVIDHGRDLNDQHTPPDDGYFYRLKGKSSTSVWVTQGVLLHAMEFPGADADEEVLEKWDFDRDQIEENSCFQIDDTQPNFEIGQPIKFQRLKKSKILGWNSIRALLYENCAPTTIEIAPRARWVVADVARIWAGDRMIDELKDGEETGPIILLRSDSGDEVWLFQFMLARIQTTTPSP